MFIEIAMRIFYAVNSNGQGHINRSRIQIVQLQKEGHEVDVLYAGKKPPDYVSDISENYLFRDSFIEFYNHKVHKVNYFRTIRHNLCNLLYYRRIRKELETTIKEGDYDVIFSDTERYSSKIAKKLGIPLVSIDHQHSIYHPQCVRPLKNFFDDFMFRIALKLMMPHYDIALATDYLKEKSIKRHKKDLVVPLVWKPEFDQFEQNIVKNHFTVYIARHDKQTLLDILISFPSVNFEVFGFNIDEQVQNILFKKTSRQGFLESIVYSKGVIGNAGFSFTSEACVLNKIMLLKPITSQYEQMTNAYRLQQLDRALVIEKLTKAAIKDFIDYAKEKDYTADAPIAIISPKEFVEIIMNELDKLEQKHLLK